MVLRAGLEGLACALIAEMGVGLRDCDTGGSSCLDEKDVVKAGAAAMVTNDLTARERPA